MKPRFKPGDIICGHNRYNKQNVETIYRVTKVNKCADPNGGYYYGLEYILPITALNKTFQNAAGTKKIDEDYIRVFTESNFVKLDVLKLILGPYLQQVCEALELSNLRADAEDNYNGAS